jgi:hypothetical protein
VWGWAVVIVGNETRCEMVAGWLAGWMGWMEVERDDGE